MKHLTEMIGSAIVVVSWIAGVVLARGFWSTVSAVFFPPYAWYLLVERFMEAFGLTAI